MAAKLAAMGESFRRAFSRVNAATEAATRIAPLPLSLSTITFTGTLNVATLPVEDMRMTAELEAELREDEEADEGEFRVDCDVQKRAAKRARTARPAGKRFRYQLPLTRRGKSLKLFHNGSVHATGCTSPLEFLEMASELERFVESVGGPAGVALVDFDIQLINTLFVVTDPVSGTPLAISPGALVRHLNSGAAPLADFDTERHPSVKIPIRVDDRKVATVCVFQTGSVSIMGAKSPDHIALAFETVCAALDACAAEVCTADPKASVRTTTAKHALVLYDGYPFNLHACCMRPGD